MNQGIDCKHYIDTARQLTSDSDAIPTVYFHFDTTFIYRPICIDQKTVMKVTEISVQYSYKGLACLHSGLNRQQTEYPKMVGLVVQIQ